MSADELQEGPAFFSLTDVGRVRPHNEDTVGDPVSLAPLVGHKSKLKDRGWLFAVADGMGGHARGEVASRLAVEVLFSSYYGNPREPMDALKRAVVAANAAVYRAGLLSAPEWAGDASVLDAPLARMGTTLVAAVVLKHTVFLANVGDSRAYLVERGQLKQVTEDHSLVAEEVRRGHLVPEQIKGIPLRNVITKALGAREEVAADFFWRPWPRGGTLLLCSDGLHGAVDDSAIAANLKGTPPQESVRRLVDAANNAGGPDNVSVIVVTGL